MTMNRFGNRLFKRAIWTKDPAQTEKTVARAETVCGLRIGSQLALRLTGRIVFAAFVINALLIAMTSARLTAQEPGSGESSASDAERHEARDLILASMQSGLESFPIDVLVDVQQTRLFDDKPTRVEEGRFRLYVDLDKQIFVRCGVEHRESVRSLDQIYPVDKLPRYVGVKIFGNTSFTYSVDGLKTQTHESFNDAIVSTNFAMPNAWGVLGFPSSTPPSVMAEYLLEAFANKSSEATVSELDDETLKIQLVTPSKIDPKYDDDFVWHIRRDDYRATSFVQRRRSKDVNALHWSQDTLYEDRGGVAVPIFIQSTTSAIRIVNGKYEVGKVHIETTIVPVKEKVEFPRTEELDAVEIEKLINVQAK